MRLGEYLVKKDIITWDQLEQALSDQLLNGGHLGTCLVEGGLVDESTLGHALAECSGTRYAASRFLEDIPSEVLEALPAKLVIRHSAIPFAMTERELDVAMIDPRNLAAVDELAFATSHSIRPWIAPEVRIFEALERYYEVPRRRRYVSLCQKLDEADPATQDEFSRMIVRPETEWGDGPTGPTRIDTPSVAEPQIAPSDFSGLASLGDEDVTESIDKMGDRFCHCESAIELTDAVLGYVARNAERSLLFRLQSGQATIWRTRGFRVDAIVKDTLCLPFASEPLFLLARGEDHYRGALPEEQEFRTLFDKIGAEPPEDVLVLPVHMNDRAVAIIYADGGTDGTVKGEIEDYRRLARKFALALQVMLLRQQILVA